MSITVGFTTSSKRENSTKQLAMPITHSCTFKNGCSMLNPTLFLELDGNSFPSYTAFKIENRYYKVTDIRSVRNNLFEIDGKVDVLATYKSNILSTTAYVLYDTIPNTELVDNRLPMKTTKSVSASATPCPLDYQSGGTYILSITGSNNSTGVYKISAGDLYDLIDDVSDIMDDFFPPTTPPDPDDPMYAGVAGKVQYIGDNFQFMGDRIKTAISNFFGSGNIPENIRECKYIPFNVGTTGSSVQICLGTYQTQTTLTRLDTDTVVRPATVSIPWQASDFRRRSPYTDVYLYMPYIGMVRLSSENLAGQTTLDVDYAVSVRDGSIIVTVRSGSQVVGQYSGNVGISVPIGISNIAAPKVATSLITGAINMAKSNIGRVGLSALQFGDAITPNFTCIGGLDGLAGIATPQNITCYTVFHDTIVAPNTEIATIGAPTMAPKSLASLTGYVQTMDASVEGAMTSNERTELNTLLNNGIFIE